MTKRSYLAAALAAVAVGAPIAGCAGKQAAQPVPQESAVSVEKTKAPPFTPASPILSGTPEELATSCNGSLAAARQSIAKLKALPASPKIQDALALYDDAVSNLQNAGARASLARNVHPTEANRTAAEKCEQDVEALNVELSLDRGVYDALTKLDLSKEDASTQMWMKKALLEFKRAGVDRDEATRGKVKSLSEELVKLGQEFNKNISSDVRKVELDPKELAGMPEDYVKAHPPGPNGKVTITSNYPDYIPFMTYAKSGKAREALWRVYRQRAHPQNLKVLDGLIAKRHELATLLGYPTWAAYTTENKMVKTQEAAETFIKKVNDAAKLRAEADYKKLLARKQKDDPKAKLINPWEQDYYDDRVKAESFGFDSQAVRPYFEYSRVLSGVMDITQELFGITYVKVTDAKVWHPDVVAYDVLEGTRPLGRIYLDMHPRDGKYKHAAQFDLTVGQEGKRLPEGVLVCNFPKPEAGAPALMQHSEVETFFHEFGHLLHHTFAGHQKWAGISGIKTEWDFVETPSMLLQEWPADAKTLARFAKHYQTGEVIPEALVGQLRASKEFGKGLWTRRQMFLSMVSLSYYNRPPPFDTTKLMASIQKDFEPFRKEHVDGTYFQLAFGHLEGYSAAYYTYAWSVVIAKDLLTKFDGQLMQPTIAKQYKKDILDPGGSKEAAKLVEDFLGRPYDFKAYETWLNQG